MSENISIEKKKKKPKIFQFYVIIIICKAVLKRPQRPPLISNVTEKTDNSIKTYSLTSHHHALI